MFTKPSRLRRIVSIAIILTTTTCSLAKGAKWTFDTAIGAGTDSLPVNLSAKTNGEDVEVTVGAKKVPYHGADRDIDISVNTKGEVTAGIGGCKLFPPIHIPVGPELPGLWALKLCEKIDPKTQITTIEVGPSLKIPGGDLDFLFVAKADPHDGKSSADEPSMSPSPTDSSPGPQPDTITQDEYDRMAKYAYNPPLELLKGKVVPNLTSPSTDEASSVVTPDKPADLATLRVNDDLSKDEPNATVDRPASDDNSQIATLTFDDNAPKNLSPVNDLDRPLVNSPDPQTDNANPPSVSPTEESHVAVPVTDEDVGPTMVPEVNNVDAPSSDSSSGYILSPTMPAVIMPMPTASLSSPATPAAATSQPDSPAPFATLRVNNDLPKDGTAPVAKPHNATLTFDDHAPKARQPVTVPPKAPASMTHAPATPRPNAQPVKQPSSVTLTKPGVHTTPTRTTTPTVTSPRFQPISTGGYHGSVGQPKGVLMRLGIDPSTLHEGQIPNDLLERIRAGS